MRTKLIILALLLLFVAALATVEAPVEPTGQGQGLGQGEQAGLEAEEAVEGEEEHEHEEVEGGSMWPIYLRFGVLALLALIGGLLFSKGLMTRKMSVIWGLGVVALIAFIWTDIGGHPSLLCSVRNPLEAPILGREIGALFYIFPAFFLLLVFVLNRSLCAFGCQVGSLQEALYWLASPLRKMLGIKKHLKLPPWLTLVTRILFVGSSLWLLVSIGFSLMSEFNPFHAFELPMALSMLVMSIVIVVSSLFVYRPWCNLFCPFGLVAWVVERVSIFRVRIDRHKCNDCGICVTESPCTAMEHILNKKGLPGDCFLCGQCVEVCPTDAVILAVKDKKNSK